MPLPQTSKLTAAVLRLLLLICVVVVLYYGKGLLLPVMVAALLAMLRIVFSHVKGLEDYAYLMGQD